MSLQSPPSGWFKGPAGHERTWIALAVGWCLVLSIMMPYWHLRGKQNSTGEAYSVTPDAFYERVMKFVEANKVDQRDGKPIVEPPPGGEAYLLAQMWSWYPVLKLRAGETYRLHISSKDLQHGFSLQPMNMNFQVLPGYDHVLTITPDSAGEFTIVCNEFCGIGHHMMIGSIIVE